MGQSEPVVIVIASDPEVGERVSAALVDDEATLIGFTVVPDIGSALESVVSDSASACVVDLSEATKDRLRAIGEVAAAGKCPVIALSQDEGLTADARSLGALDVLGPDEMNGGSIRRSLLLALAHDQARRSALAEEAELGGFAALATHDLQAPLRKAQMFLNAFSAELPDGLDPGTAELLDRAGHAIEQMRGLVAGLFAYSDVDIDRAAREPVDLARLVAEACGDIEPLVEEFEARIEIGDLPTVAGRADDLRLVFVNLLLNALSFRSTERPLEVSVAAAPGDPAVVTVSDNGLGFETSDPERLFGVFHKESSGGRPTGAGLGLAVARRVMRSHGGSISASRNADGVGSRFEVRFGVAHRP